MAVTLVLQSTNSPSQVETALRRLTEPGGAPPMPPSVSGRFLPATLFVRIRADSFVLGYRSAKRPAPAAEARGRVVPTADGGARVEVRIGLPRQYTIHTAVFGGVLALPLLLMGDWLIAGVILAASFIAVGINHGFDADLTLEDERQATSQNAWSI